MKASQTQLFAVQGGGKTLYTWTVYPATGTISAAGLYTAPSSISLKTTVTIYAEAANLPTLTATVTLMPTVSITVMPTAISLSNGQSAAFYATVTGTTNTAYTWTTPLYGTLDSSGNYSVPMTLNTTQTVHITATSVEDPTKIASSTVTLVPTVSVAFSPTSTSLTGGQSTALNGVVYGSTNTGINWSVSPQIGTLANGYYTAPSPISSPETVTITATSQATSSRSASVVISLVPVSISLSPSSTTLTDGQSTNLNPTVTGSGDTVINWTISPAVGTVNNGVYTAPSPINSTETVTITATSAADPSKSASTVITLKPGVIITMTPSTASLTGGQSTTFTATVTGATNTGVTWSMSPSAGTLSNGVYTAPATIASAETVTVTATSAANTAKTASATVSLVPVSVSISPSSASLSGGGSATFKATVAGSSNTTVNWSLSPSVGTIANGVYTAPATIALAQTVTVKATSAADSTKSASVTVSLTPVSLSISPSAVSLAGGQSTTFNVSLSGTTNAGVTWSMSPSMGTLSSGVYTAPATIASAQTVTVTVTSAADSTKTASAVVSLVPPVSISVSPTTASVSAGQSVTLAAGVTGTSNTAVNWTVAPQIGTVSNGVYTAPSQIALQQSVIVTATSAADSTKTASASITLLPAVSVTVTPPSVSLTGGQTQQFNASLSGTSNPNVTWTMSPNVGSISNGLYQAPQTITNQQTVTVTATSSADTTKSASATITLLPPTAIALTPSSVSLTGGQSAQFNVTIGGTPTTAITWSLAPSVGTITNGVYTAPVSITALQTIILTVASTASPSQTAQATITLNTSATTSPSVSPSLATLNSSQTQQFTAANLGTNPVWSISPSTGTITTAGLYTAPSAISATTTVTVKATNGSNSASATVTLNASAGASGNSGNGSGSASGSGSGSSTTITLPLEVLGPNGYTVSASFNIPSGSATTGLTLWMQIHGLRTQTQASVQLNNAGWQPISEGNVTLLGLANAYGGIGGGYHTLSMTMPIPDGTIQTGANTVTFKFNQTDGRVSGFRVLAFNLQDTNGNSLIPASTFVQDDPNAWQPPSTNPSDIAAGQSLWRTASLTVPTSSGPAAIKAHCMDCHSEDGRDLKYFNYSNTSIHNRSVFHGLTPAQGDQIASFIRSLSVPNPGRPWNPPYQPGPGLDSQPVEQWAGGAGLDAVLDSDADMMSAMVPAGMPDTFFAASNTLNVRETQVAMQLPDWNSWLPTVHPIDAFSDFLGSPFYQNYLTLHSALIPNSSASYAAAAQSFDEWTGNFGRYIQTKTNIAANAWTTTVFQQLDGVPHWALVKSWELNQEFGLEGMARVVYSNPRAEARGWRSQYPFMTSPNMVRVPRGSAAFENGLVTTWVFDAFIWYHLQLVLNNGGYEEHGASPIDFGYTWAKIADTSSTDSLPQAALLTLWQTKGAQLMDNGYGPDNSDGFQWQPTDISRLTTPGMRTLWNGTPAATRKAIYQGLVEAWLSTVQKFTPQQFYNSVWDGTVSASQVPQHFVPDSQYLVDRVWYMISKFKYWGVNQTQINQLAAWAQTIWPLGNWAATTTATCAPDTGDPTIIRCNTDN